MTRPVVADTGPLIALARVERLELLRWLFERVVVPPAVHAELVLDSNRPGARVLSSAFDAGWSAVTVVADSALGRELAQLLGPCEAEATAKPAESSPPSAPSSETCRARGIACPPASSTACSPGRASEPACVHVACS